MTRSFHSIEPDALDLLLRDEAEIAVLDLRDAEAYGYGEPLTGTPVALDALAERAPLLLPRRSVRIVLVDGAGGAVAERAAPVLAGLGYTDVHVLRGGLAAWAAAGHHSTLHRPAPVFTRQVAQDRQTPRRTPRFLAEVRERGQDVVVIDTRTPEEFVRGHVPGAVNVIGAELLLRFKDIVPSADTLVLTNCAGLPRAIVGAQTLIDAGVPNTVALLEDGTKGWLAEGWELEVGEGAAPGEPSAAALADAALHAHRLAGAAPLEHADPVRIQTWRRDRQRSTYLLDLRGPQAFARGSLAGAVPLPAGQLILNAQRWAATRGARLVLLDDPDGVRATTVAHWLRQRDWDVVWHAVEPAPAGGETAAARREPLTA